MEKSPSLIKALIPVIFLIVLLAYNVIFVFGDDALAGSNQIILLLAAGVAAVVGIAEGIPWKTMRDGITASIASTVPSLILLLFIGALAGTWLVSGIIPAMIYYGLDLLHPSIFLVASCLICAIVSLATGSSWSTIATVGIALLGIGKALGISEAVIGGAVISGAYFGDKISPMSDTTNLAPAMAGTDLFTHLRYMLYTTVPSITITLLIFLIMGLNSSSNVSMADASLIQDELDATFNINGWLFLVPITVIAMIVKKVPAIPALVIGVLLAALFAVIFQADLILGLAAGSGGFAAYYTVIMDAMAVSVAIPAENPLLADLLTSGGMSGMMNTIWLIVCAMTFGGVMESTGFLETLSSALIKRAKSTTALVSTTVATCLTLNVTASDQYLAIVVPGRMYADVFKKRGLAPQVLSRTLEDSGTVTSVLIPWNTCGATQAAILGVATLSYAPFTFFCILSPIMTIVFAAFNIKIARIPKADSLPSH
ncbi:MAG: Na+/H+ antiporter NhaC [Flavobacteriales bacterium]|nr:Na+/H+ antiporter NhaC [Flavobacteriales bacterium]